VRRNLMERRKLAREMITVRTEYGTVEVKVGRIGNRIVQASPEFESCRSVAAMAGVPIRLVYQATAAVAAARLASGFLPMDTPQVSPQDPGR